MNINNKLLSYISNKELLTQSHLNQYRNSLIFIGDEQQIFIPSLNAYVGIPKTSYDYLMTNIDNKPSSILLTPQSLNTYYNLTFNTADDNIQISSYESLYYNTSIKYNPYNGVLKTNLFEGQLDPKDQWGII